MKRIQMGHTKNTLAIAVLMAIGGAAQAAVDAWSFSGQDARAEALQSNYVNLIDSYNIWVNPALVTQNSNRVDVNVKENGVANNDNEAGAGAYKTFGDNTFGAYLGRPSDSLLSQVPINGTGAFFFNTLDHFATATTAGVPIPDTTVKSTQNVTNPSNQFDLFWGTSAPAALNVGVRLNYQAITNQNDSPEFTVLDPNAVPGTFTGPRTTDTVSSNSSDATARELNLAVGLADKVGVWDATLLLGRPSSDSTARYADQRLVETVTAGAVTGRTVDSFSGKQSISTDGARNIGLAGRLHNIIPNTVIALQYQRLNNSYSSNITGSKRAQVDADNNGVNETDTTTDFTQEGAYDNKATNISVYFTRNFVPVPNNLILATVGLVRYNGTAKTVNTVTSNSTTNNLLPGSTPSYNVATPYLGEQTNGTIKQESFALPLIVGFEGAFTANTTLRAALHKDLYNRHSTTSTTENWAFPATGTAGDTNPTQTIQTATERTKSTEIWNTPTTLSLGAGYKDGGLTVDAVLQKEFVTAGTNNGLVSRVNVTYLLP